jgi:maltooligosyltrehalose trehalohydrolase
VHGPSLVVDPRAYRWRNPDWRGRQWREAVIYELHVGAFGGFEGVRKQLARLAKIGVTAVELMPINDFPGSRNWGYDGVLPYAPDTAYGSPEELKALIDAAHDHGLMMFLDVVYNHFGPDGNYLGAYAPQFFHTDRQSNWGPTLDFRVPELRRFFTENALYWLLEYRFDGLRFDAVHAIPEPGWLDEMAAAVRGRSEPEREIHLILEHEGNVASHLAGNFDAQWNDDGHHVLHVLLTDETEGYYEDYADHPAERLARCLKEGFVYQGEPSRHRGGKARGTPSAGLPPTAFVLFLQNHDQIGNRAFGERLTCLADAPAIEAALALLLLCPQIPLLFMGEEFASRTPFYYFTDHHGELAEAVRKGRRAEFASFAAFGNPEALKAIPDPNTPRTFFDSIPVSDPELGAKRTEMIQHLLSLRRDHIVPRLDGAKAHSAGALGLSAVEAEWRMGDGAMLTILANFGTESIQADMPRGRLLFESTPGASAAISKGELVGRVTLAYLDDMS